MLNRETKNNSFILTKDWVETKFSNEDIRNTFNVCNMEGKTITEISEEYLSPSFAAWAISFLPLTNEDQFLMVQKAGIKNSSNTFVSYDINNCDMISHSAHCNDSYEIENSEYVNDSSSVFNSVEVLNSFIIYDSETIKNSNRIRESSFVENSSSIYKSKEINSSDFIFESEKINNSWWLFSCTGASNSILCTGLMDAENCILSGKPVGEYTILNKKVSETIFKNVKERLIETVMQVKEPRELIQGSDTVYFDVMRKTFNYPGFWLMVKNILPSHLWDEEAQNLIYHITLCESVFAV